MKKYLLCFLFGFFFGVFLIILQQPLVKMFLQNGLGNSCDVVDFRKLSHLGIIMDGNRRWAKERGLPVYCGHLEGSKKAREIVSFASKTGIKFLSLYVLSVENLDRSEKEKEYLYDLIVDFFNEEQIEKLKRDNIRVLIVGDVSLFPKKLLPIIKDIQEITKENTGLTLALLFCYGGKQELLSCCNKLLQNKKNSEFLTPESFQENLWSKDLPDVDLLIRTGGRNRISNFLLWQLSYAELIFLDLFWPDMNVAVLKKACEKFLRTPRSFGC